MEERVRGEVLGGPWQPTSEALAMAASLLLPFCQSFHACYPPQGVGCQEVPVVAQLRSHCGSTKGAEQAGRQAQPAAAAATSGSAGASVRSCQAWHVALRITNPSCSKGLTRPVVALRVKPKRQVTHFVGSVPSQAPFTHPASRSEQICRFVRKGGGHGG